MKKNYFTYVFILLVVLGAALFYNGESNADMQAGISQKILRLHIVANSDSAKDQALKLKIKDEVVSYLENILKDSSSLNESIDIVSRHYDDINQICLNVMNSEGYSYTVQSAIENTEFPIKTYGDITLPAGSYTALRITIGKSEGQNWWCILYPPLCFVDATCGVVPDDSKKELKKTLTEAEYHSILNHNTNTTFRFKYLTFLNDLFATTQP